MSSKVVLILGAGQNIGKSLIQKFSSNGFKVAIASRTLYQPLVEAADVSVKADFANPSSIKSIFSEVVAKIGTPNVVIYNGMCGVRGTYLALNLHIDTSQLVLSLFSRRTLSQLLSQNLRQIWQ